MFLATGDDKYRYATFLRFLEEQGDVIAAVEAVNKGGSATPQRLDAALRTTMKRSLAGLFHDFALEYFHFDLWRGEILAPDLHFGNSAIKQANTMAPYELPFAFVTRAPTSGEQAGVIGQINLFASTTIDALKPLTAAGLPVHIQVMPENRRGKLIFLFEPLGPLNLDLTASYVAATVGAALPAQGETRGTPVSIELKRPSSQVEVRNIASPGGFDRVNVVVSNGSLDTSAPRLRVSRWALLAPEWVRSSEEPGSWSWQVRLEKKWLEGSENSEGGLQPLRGVGAVGERTVRGLPMGKRCAKAR